MSSFCETDIPLDCLTQQHIYACYNAGISAYVRFPASSMLWVKDCEKFYYPLTPRFPLDTDYSWHRGFHATFHVTQSCRYQLTHLNVRNEVALYIKKTLNIIGAPNGSNPIHDQITEMLEKFRNLK